MGFFFFFFFSCCKGWVKPGFLLAIGVKDKYKYLKSLIGLSTLVLTLVKCHHGAYFDKKFMLSLARLELKSPAAMSKRQYLIIK
jgi:hypothetical protein